MLIVYCRIKITIFSINKIDQFASLMGHIIVSTFLYITEKID